MNRQGIQSKIIKKWRVTTNASHKYPVVTNRLNREFVTQSPNEVSSLVHLRSAH
jgi:putative transposase